jgi:alanine racemase
MRDTSWIEINKENIKKNIKYLKKRIENAKFTSVIKGNAYGHGIKNYLPVAESCGVNSFAVSDAYEADEAYKVKSEGTELIIMYMIDNGDLEWAIRNDIAFYVFDFYRLEKTIEVSKKIGIKAKIHIELETGMNRTGFEEKDINKLIDILKSNLEYVKFEGICTHFAGAESVANYLRITNQFDKFKKFRDLFNTLQLLPAYYHSACSAAVLTYPETILNMVRIGIAQYGFWPSKETRMYNLLSDSNRFTKDPLHRSLSWKSKIMTVKNVKAGDFVSYGTSHLALKNERLAIIPVGYSHGYSRSLSNLGHVLINKRKSPIVGMVNMNLIIADITNIKDANVSTEVVLIGKQGNHEISVSSFSDLANYVNYEMLTRLPSHIPRIVK